ncbi:MAG: MarC family protein [Candidatus Brocadia sp.]|nr:MarC family protein [Candidatus Brocadia sp.]UJS17667.1 MAG: MarC family protein [Candidatus Jettenia sp.]
MKRVSFFLVVIIILFHILICSVTAQTTSVNQFQTTASSGQQAQYILGIPEIFTFFMFMLGPIKVLVPFVKMTRDTDTRFRRKLALIATLISTIGCLVAAFMGQRILKSWHISISALMLAGGIILFLVALQMIMQMYSLPRRNGTTSSTPTLAMAVSPLSFPTIVTPYGIAMLIILMASAQDVTRQAGIIGALLAIMVLNLLTMLFAHRILKVIGVITLQILGSVLGVLQVALGIEIILQTLIKMGLMVKTS